MFLHDGRKIPDARVAVTFEFCVRGQQRQAMDARRRHDEFVRRIVDREIREARGFDDDVAGERQHPHIVRHGGLEPRGQIHRQRQLPLLIFFGGFPKAENAQAENFARVIQQRVDFSGNGAGGQRAAQPHAGVEQMPHWSASQSADTGSSMSAGNG